MAKGIEHLIRRTLIYSVLIVVMALIYVGSVLILQTAFSIIFHLTSDSLAIVLSTLAIAVLFTPVRLSIQRSIDQRFFRHKYNAEQILAGFNASIRTEVVLEPLASALLKNAEATMHSEYLSLWLVLSEKNERYSKGLKGKNIPAGR